MSNATSQATTQAIDQLAEGIDSVRSQAAPALERLVSDAERLTRRGLAAVRDGTQRVGEQTARATDATIGYIKDEPVRSVLIAAAVGAALMALVGLVSRSNHGPR
jgi:ElaB/YqjD/DUF883 family membrane-anchored ribosome-binding protein